MAKPRRSRLRVCMCGIGASLASMQGGMQKVSQWDIENGLLRVALIGDCAFVRGPVMLGLYRMDALVVTSQP